MFLKSTKFFIVFLFIFGTYACKKEEVAIGPNVKSSFFIHQSKRAVKVHVLGNTQSKKYMLLPYFEPINSLVNQAWFADLSQNMAMVIVDFSPEGDFKKLGISNSDLNQMAEMMSLAADAAFVRYGNDIQLSILGEGYLAPIALETSQLYDLPKKLKATVFINPIFNVVEATGFTVVKLKADAPKIIDGLNSAILVGANNAIWTKNLKLWKQIKSNIEPLNNVLTIAEINEIHTLDLEELYSDSLVNSYQNNWAKQLIDSTLIKKMSPATSYMGQLVIGQSVLKINQKLDEYNPEKALEKLNQKVIFCQGNQSLFCTKAYLKNQIAKARNLEKINIKLIEINQNGQDILGNQYQALKNELLK